MRKTALILLPLLTLSFFLLPFNLRAQPCLPQGITFTSQVQIDNFQINHPNCTEIEGNVLIGVDYGNDINNLNGLNCLTAIYGNLEIEWTDIVDLSGLDNIDSIGGTLLITYNSQLSSFTGMNSLNYIGGFLSVIDNPSIVTISSFDNLSYIGGSLTIRDNPLLCSCDLLSICTYLSAPNGEVNIYNNGPGCNSPPEIANNCGFTMPCLPYGNYYFFTQDDIDEFLTNYPGCAQLEGDATITGSNINNLNGLLVLTNIGGDLSIHDNPQLTILEGLNNINYIGGSLIIESNDNLTTLSGLENLVYIGGDLMMGHWFILYGWGTYINGNEKLTSLSALSNIYTIFGNVSIARNDMLVSLAGLNLSYIQGSFDIGGNDALANLNGLQNLSSIGGDLIIGRAGFYYCLGNSNLQSISGLDGLTTIDGILRVAGNDFLTSLAGLDNIEANSIQELDISWNGTLSICAVQSVCDYLAAPGAIIAIDNNAPGCNSQQEVEEACDSITSDGEVYWEDGFTISPNPCSYHLQIKLTIEDIRLTICDLFDVSGRRIRRLVNEEMMTGTYEMDVDLSDLPAGIYFCTLKTNPPAGIQTRKIIKI